MHFTYHVNMIDLKRQAELRESIELFYFAYRAFTSRPDCILAEQGLGRVHHRILYFVARYPDIAVHALLDILEVSKQALNGPLRQLIEKKLIDVRTAEHDRRFKQLRLSETGMQLEEQLTHTQMEHLATAFEAVANGAETSWQLVMRELPKKV